MSNADIDKIELAFNALDIIAENAGKAYKDKKIDLQDLPLLINVAVEAKTFLDAIQGFKEAVSEASDLDASEQLQIVKRFFQVANKYEAARKA